MKYDTQGLKVAGMDIVAPFSVEVRLDPVIAQRPVASKAGQPAETVLDDSIQVLEFQNVARVLPGRRVSGLVQAESGDTYFAKVFFGEGARRYWQREINGALSMQKAQVSTPAVINEGATADGCGYVVLYEALPQAEPLQEDATEQLHKAVIGLAALHEAGFQQSDPHLGNFLCAADGRVFLVDADGVRKAQKLDEQLANLGVFFAQRAPVFDADIEPLWKTYLAHRDEYVSRMAGLKDAQAHTHKQRQERIRRYLTKTQRSCTEFVVKQEWHRAIFCQRKHWSSLQRLLYFPEEYLAQGEVVKLGRSATVVRVNVDQRSYIIKRYNIKSVPHRVRRWFKPRARLSWRNGHLLQFMGVPTARPVALVEHKWGWFRGVCYLIMPDAGEATLPELLAEQPETFGVVVPQVADILARLKAAGLVHGDLKATNLVTEPNADQAHRLVLIDYDGLTQVKYPSDVPDTDVRRFMANWADDAELSNRWERALQQASDPIRSAD